MGLLDSMVIGAIVFVPLAISLWFVLIKYTYPSTKYTYFNGQRLMFCIAGGMIIGLIVSLAYRFFPPYFWPFALFFAFTEEMIRLVILNSPMFQLKFDSVFYGAALGAGTATMIVSGIAYTTEYGPGKTYADFWTPVLIATLVIFSISTMFLNVGCGALIGYGCGKGMGWTWTFKAILVHLIFAIAMIGVIYPDQNAVGIFFYPSLAGMLVLGFGIYYYSLRTAIDDALPDNLRKQRRREIMKTAREKVGK